MKHRGTLVAWAAAALKGTAQQKALRVKADKVASAVATRFGLDALERRVLDLAYAAERSFAVAALARAKAGGLTVELLREALGDEVDAALAPRRALRRHALVTVGTAGLAAAGDLVCAAPGVAERIDGVPDPEGLWRGVMLIGAQAAPPGAGLPARVGALLGELDPAAPSLLTLDGCPRREAHELALGVARVRKRAVLLVDGEALAEAPDAALLLACARREADCDGAALLVCEAEALGERWRALLAPAAGAAPLVILADAARTRDPVAAAPFAVRRLTLHAPPSLAPVVATPTPAAEAKKEEAAPADDGLDSIRQMAIRDAERALGVYRAPPPPPRPVHKPMMLPGSAPPAQAAAPAPQPTRAAPEPTRPASEPTRPAPEPTRAAPQEVRSATERVETPPAAAPARTEAPPPAADPTRRMSRNAMKYFNKGQPPADEPAAAPRAPAPPPAPAPAATSPTPDAGAEAAAGPDGTPLPLSPDATLDELARAAATSPSAAQRIELIERIRGHRSAAVVAALRANTQSAHPGVRAAAEAAMAALFGANWNTTRPVPKPVQRPPSDDKDRGPPGGW